MKRLVYLYVSNGSAHPDFIPKWDPKIISSEFFAHNIKDEGFYFLFCLLLEQRVFDEVLIVVESTRSPGHLHLSNQMQVLVVPHISELKKFMRDGDILWARGGWRSWFAFLEEWHDQDRWLLFYRAATNRGTWNFWDIVFDDLRTEFAQDEAGRFYYPIKKPINPTIFAPISKKRNYDVMIGASHVHDKKRQYLMIEVLKEYYKKYHTNLHCVLPGSIHRGVYTASIIPSIAKYNLDVTLTGMVNHHQLAALYNDCSIFVHCGVGGQNDRGPLEALSCGTPIMLANEQYHAPCIRPFKTFGSFPIEPDNPQLAAEQIHQLLEKIKAAEEKFRDITFASFQMGSGIDDVILPQFSYLFKQILNTPHNKRQEWFNSLLKGQRAYEASGNDKKHLS